LTHKSTHVINTHRNEETEMTKVVTKAGQAVLDKYQRALASGRLGPLVKGDGEPVAGNWLKIGVGNGAELSAAQKLARDGHLRIIGGAHNHWVSL
jgi:hypothetical protein